MCWQRTSTKKTQHQKNTQNTEAGQLNKALSFTDHFFLQKGTDNCNDDDRQKQLA